MKNQKINIEEILRIHNLVKNSNIMKIDSYLEKSISFQVEAKKKAFLGKLSTKLQKEMTLGELLETSINGNNIKIEDLSQEIRTPLNILKDLCIDNIFPFTVPINTMKRLLQKLNIRLDLAISAIMLTTSNLTDRAEYHDPFIGQDKAVFARRGGRFIQSFMGNSTAYIGDLAQVEERFIKRLKEVFDEGEK
jgi:hypothetical protein